MSGYIARLAHQTGVKIGQTSNAPHARPTNLHAVSTPEIVEQHIESESRLSAAESAQVSSPREAPTRSAARSTSELSQPHTSFSAEGQPKTAIVSGPSDTRREPSEILIAPQSPLRRASEIVATDSVASGEFTASQIVQEVMAWIATDDSAPVSKESTSPSDASEVAATSEIRGMASAAAQSADSITDVSQGLPPTRADHPLNASLFPSRSSDPASTSVHIGAIHLSIEAPSEKPATPRMETTRTAPPTTPPRPVGSRLRLHYLRPC